MVSRHRPIIETFVTAVLGIDGSGKSTLSRRLAEGYGERERTGLVADRAEVIERGEVTDLHAQLTEHLRQRIAARAKEAASLERYKIPKIAELLLRDRLIGEMAREYRPARLFMDGMPVLNLTAWTILYHASDFADETCAKVLCALTQHPPVPPEGDAVYESFPELLRLRELGFDHLHVPDATIFLDVPPEVCVSRIAARGKAAQVHETTVHLTRLRDAYLTVCDVLERGWGLPVLVLEGDRQPSVVAEEARRFVDGCWKARHGE
jgi:hypothetical protein